jgi:hypothetical protein
MQYGKIDNIQGPAATMITATSSKCMPAWMTDEIRKKAVRLKAKKRVGFSNER